MRFAFSFVFLLLVLPVPLWAQRRAPTISPQIAEGGKVFFRLDAPNATKVDLTGQWPSGNQALSKNENGVWEIAVESIPAGVWEYSFRLDGVTILDPGNHEIKPMRSPRTSILHIPSNPPAPHDFQDIPHGTVHRHSYLSKVANRVRHLEVYTPPGYEQQKEAVYPTLYLLHGSGDNQATWVAHGKAHWIADHLSSQKSAVPMIIVMMDGHIAPPNDPMSNVDLFEKDLLEQVLPFIESTYRAAKAADKRGIVGLSMGGGQSLTIGLRNSEIFGWVGGFSSGTPSDQSIENALNNASETNARLKLLWIACGKDDFLLKRNEEFIATLKSKGISHDWKLTDGNHSWPIWRTYLAEFLPLLFQR